MSRTFTKLHRYRPTNEQIVSYAMAVRISEDRAFDALVYAYENSGLVWVSSPDSDCEGRFEPFDAGIEP